MPVLSVSLAGRLGPFQGMGLEDALARATSKGLRDMMRAMKSASVKAVRFRKKIKVRKINDSLPVSYALKGHIDDLEATMKVSGAPIPLVEYPHRQTSKGVSVQVNARRALIKSAFVATMKSGHTGVFVREGKGRLPIKELFSTRVSDVFGDAGMIDAVIARGLQTFDQTFERVMPLELDRLK